MSINYKKYEQLYNWRTKCFPDKAQKVIQQEVNEIWKSRVKKEGKISETEFQIVLEEHKDIFERKKKKGKITSFISSFRSNSGK